MLLKEILRNLSNTRAQWVPLLSASAEVDDESTAMINKLPLNAPYRYALPRMYTPRARYDYTIDENLIQILNTLYKLVGSYHPVLQCLQNMVDVETYGATSMINNPYAFVYVSVLASLDEVNTVSAQYREFYVGLSKEYEEVDTGDNAYVFIPKDIFFTDEQGNLRYNSIQIVMHRNSDRNAHINDAVSSVCNRLLNLINSSAYSVHQFTTDELKDWNNLELTEYDELYDAALDLYQQKQRDLMDAKERIRLERKEYVESKIQELLPELTAPIVRDGTAVPLRNADQLAQDIRNQINSCMETIKQYQEAITKKYYEIEKLNLELMASLQNKDDSRGKLIEALDRMLHQPNGYLRHYIVTEKGDVTLAFIAPTIYWEDDEVAQWGRTSYKKEVRLITSKRFQMWTRCLVTIKHNSGVSGGDFDSYSIDDCFYDVIHDDSLQLDKDKIDEAIAHVGTKQSLSVKRGLACAQYNGHTIPHQHIARFSCFGNNADLIHKALRESNYDLALSVIVHCVTQLNLTDSCVVEHTCRMIQDYNYLDFFYDTEKNEWISPDAAYTRMEEAANESN